MAISIINVGAAANDGNGDSIRDAFIKVNDNDADLDGRVATNASNIATNTANITENTTAFNAKNPKDGVRVATTANTNLTATQTIDGLPVVIGDSVLVKNQTVPSQNGIYIVQDAAWTRAPDANTSAKVTSGLRITVREGTVNANTGWHLTTAGTIILDTTALTFEQFANVAAGAGGFPTFSGALVNLSADVVVTSGTIVNVAWNQEVEDTDAFHDNITNNSRLTIPTNGRYVVMANIRTNGSGAFAKEIRIRKNGLDFLGGALSADAAWHSVTTYPLSVVAGDFFELEFDNGGTGNRTILASDSSFGIYRIE